MLAHHIVGPFRKQDIFQQEVVIFYHVVRSEIFSLKFFFFSISFHSFKFYLYVPSYHGCLPHGQ